VLKSLISFVFPSTRSRADEEFDELLEFIGGIKNLLLENGDTLGSRVFVIGPFGSDRRSVDFSDSKCYEEVPVFQNWHFSIPNEIDSVSFEEGKFFVSSYGVPWPGVVSVTKDQIKRDIKSWASPGWWQAGTNLEVV
jgi:hypothetical protein